MSSPFPINAFVTAILKDCDTVLENYKNYPNSCHASNAQFILDELHAKQDRDGNFNEQSIKYMLHLILNKNFSVHGRSIDEAVDGPASLAHFANVKDVFTSEMQNLLHKPYKAVKDYAKANGYTVFKTYCEPAELQAYPDIMKNLNRLEVRTYVGLNVQDEFVQQVNCYRNGVLIATARIA